MVVSLPIPDPAPPSAFKYRLPVTLAVAGGPGFTGYVSLSKQSEFRPGPQTLLERFNERVRIVPLVDGDVTHLVARDLIEWVEGGPGVDSALFGPAVFAVTRIERACVSLRSGRVLEGLIAMEMPEGYNRTSDFINGDDDFFVLCCGERTLLVNKRRLRDLRLDSTRPPGC